MNSSIRVSDVFQPSWKYTKSQIWILAGLYIGYIIISFTLGIFVSAANGSVGGGLLSALVSMVLAAMFYLGYFQNMFQTMDGEEPQFSAYLQSPQKIVNVIVATLVYGIVVLLGTVLLIIPGIYVAIRLQFFLMFILDERQVRFLVPFGAYSNFDYDYRTLSFGNRLLCGNPFNHDDGMLYLPFAKQSIKGVN